MINSFYICQQCNRFFKYQLQPFVHDFLSMFVWYFVSWNSISGSIRGQFEIVRFIKRNQCNFEYCLQHVLIAIFMQIAVIPDEESGFRWWPYNMITNVSKTHFFNPRLVLAITTSTSDIRPRVVLWLYRQMDWVLKITLHENMPSYMWAVTLDSCISFLETMFIVINYSVRFIKTF